MAATPTLPAETAGAPTPLDAGRLHPVSTERLEIPGTAIYLPLAGLLAKLA